MLIVSEFFPLKIMINLLFSIFQSLNGFLHFRYTVRTLNFSSACCHKYARLVFFLYGLFLPQVSKHTNGSNDTCDVILSTQFKTTVLQPVVIEDLTKVPTLTKRTFNQFVLCLD